MQLCHTPAALSAVFDEPNLIACAGLVPAVALADRIGLRDLADEWLTVPGSTRDAPGSKVMSLVAGMLAGADSIDDMDLLRHGGMDKVFADVRAPSTLGTFLRAFTFGHVRQLDAVASRALIGLAERGPGLLAGSDGVVMLDIDDTVKPVFGAAKQGAQHGYTRVKGLNAQLATISTEQAAPVIVGARLRRGAAASAHGAVRLIRDAIDHRPPGWGDRADPGARRLARTTSTRSSPRSRRPGPGSRSVPARTARCVGRSRASTTRRGCASSTPQAILDPDTGELVSCAEVAEVPYLAFTSHGSKAVPGRLIVRRVPERNTRQARRRRPGGPVPGLAVSRDLHQQPRPAGDRRVPAPRARDRRAGHRRPEGRALAHLPSGRFHANAAWLVAATIAFNLTRAIGVAAGGKFTRAEAATVRARILNTPARVSRSGRRQRLHLPKRWPWATQWQALWTTVMTT